MADPNLPITATKVWVPLLVAGSGILATVTGLPELGLSDADALNLVIVVLLGAPLAQSALTWFQRTFLTRPVEIPVPGGVVGLPAGTPWWHGPVRYAAIAVGAGLAGMLLYRLL